MIGNFFHTPKPRTFNINYRYYDPLKEEMKEREDRIKKELGMADKNDDLSAGYRPHIKGQFRQSLGNVSKTVKDAKRRSNRRLVFLIILLSLIAYLFFKF